MTKLAGEIEAKKIQADVLMVSDPGYYITLKDKNLLLKFDAPNRKFIAEKYKDSEGYWTAVRLSYMLMAYNTTKVKPEDAPKSFKDLTDPKWKDRLAMANPLLSGSILTVVADLSQRYGWDYFKTLKSNGIKIEGGNTAVQNKLVTGEYFVGIIGEENILKVADKGEPLKVAYPADGAVILPSPIAIFSSSQNPEAAKALTDWWLSKEGQEMVVKGWMHSVREDVAPPKGAPALKTMMPTALKIDWDQLAKENEKFKENFRSRVLEKK
jgi:iron(III) transport system substrate-binding protein